jgi:2-methylisocitrate lyase-like PEP mutase family enzyme
VLRQLQIGTAAKKIYKVCLTQMPSVSELQDLGVTRVSYGSGFLKAAIGATKRLG